MKTLVFGVLGNFNYKPVNLKIGDREYNGTLISALKEHYNADLLLFAPESLITFIPHDIKESYKYLIDWEKLSVTFKDFLKKGGIDADFVEIIPSIGHYMIRDKENPNLLDFQTEPTTIRSVMFLSLIKKIQENQYDRLILDVSIGLNLYVSILQDIYRDIIVNRKLTHMFGEFSSNTWIAEIPPVVGNIEGGTYKVSIREYDVKVFFVFPYKTKFPEIGSIMDFLLIKSGDDGKRVTSDYKKIKECMALYRIIFNAIKYNAPLMLTTKFFKEKLKDKKCLDFDIMGYAQSIFKNLMKIWLNKRDINMKERDSLIKIDYPTLKSEQIKTVYHSLALAHALQQEYIRKIFNMEPSTHSIMSVFSAMYDALGMTLNKRFLQRDLANIEGLFKNVPENRWVNLSKIIHHEHHGRNRKAPTWTDTKRNFFAHSGLLSEFVYGLRKENAVRIEYKDASNYTTIKKWLEKPND